MNTLVQPVTALRELPDMAGKVAVVTGGTAGVGLAVARGLAAAGATTVITAREAARGERARADIDGTATAVVPMDLARLATVRSAAAEIQRRWERLDVLVCAAGYEGHGAREKTADGFEMTFGVNHLGHAGFVLDLLERLRTSAPARVVIVASQAHHRARAGLDFDDLQAEHSFRPRLAYNRSKLANILFARELARRLEGTGVAVGSVHPGGVDTAMMRANFTSTVGRWCYPIVRLGLLTPDQAAAAVLRVAVDPSLAGMTGTYFNRGKPAKPHPAACDDAAARRLWEVTLDLLDRDAADG